MKKLSLIILGVAFISGSFFYFTKPTNSHAANIDELKKNIEDRTTLIKKLESEISAYTEKINTTSSQAVTLQNTILILNSSIAKLSKETELTQNKIAITNATIGELSDTIGIKTNKIDSRHKVLASSLREVNADQSNTLLETLLNYESLSEFWNRAEAQSEFQGKIRENVVSLKSEKTALQENKAEVEKQKQDLIEYKKELADQKQAVEYSKKEKDTILLATKNKESEYRKILDDKVSAKKAFEKEVYDFESQLKIAVDPSLLPESRPGIISWPLDKVFVTQLFGKTVDSHRLYATGSHNGEDFRATIGTKVKAVLDGVIEGTGDTGLFPGCYSYGRWILIRHNNGLSSIYGHLSVISVSKGTRVKTGDTIGYSGNTGYSTGPHLHLGIFATQGVRILKNENSNFCKQAYMPLAPKEAYLDPGEYLPH